MGTYTELFVRVGLREDNADELRLIFCPPAGRRYLKVVETAPGESADSQQQNESAGGSPWREEQDAKARFDRMCEAGARGEAVSPQEAVQVRAAADRTRSVKFFE
ncbi:Uncharacterised protein [Mycobacteroides abscessus subsp. massiliense]|nr:Uncharacterised protein [Mycobacteroides abscessus subsp. massiliense]